MSNRAAKVSCKVYPSTEGLLSSKPPRDKVSTKRWSEESRKYILVTVHMSHNVSIYIRMN